MAMHGSCNRGFFFYYGRQICCIGDSETTWPPAWRAATRQGELQPWPQELEPQPSGAARRPPAAGMLQPLSGKLEPRCSGAARRGGRPLDFWDDAPVDRQSKIDAGTSPTERRRRCSPELGGHHRQCWNFPSRMLETPGKKAATTRRRRERGGAGGLLGGEEGEDVAQHVVWEVADAVSAPRRRPRGHLARCNHDDGAFVRMSIPYSQRSSI